MKTQSDWRLINDKRIDFLFHRSTTRSRSYVANDDRLLKLLVATSVLGFL